MASKAELLRLAERVEALEGPERRLDLAIDVAVRPDEWAENIRNNIERTCAEWFDPEELPNYTASLDAAMTLVPEGCGVHMASEYGDTLVKNSHTFALTGRTWARVYTPHHGSFETTAATPALALTAACLRAIAQEDGR